MDDARLFLCARCRRQVLICSRCDRGQQYCGARCSGVRHFIDQQRKESDKPPPLALALPDDPRLRTLSVRPHDLADYDRLHDESDSADEEQSRDDDNEQDNSD